MFMFYVKHNGKKILIEDDNPFTMCPRCGKEMQVSLAELDIWDEALWKACKPARSAAVVQ